MSKLSFCGAEVTVIRSARKSIAVQIKPEGLTVRAPRNMRDSEINAFLDQKRSWIEKHLAEVSERRKRQEAMPKLSEEELRALTARAKEEVPARVAYYAPLVGVSFGRITIRAQHTRWGSCSGKGNLSFNCLLMLMPEEIIDSVIVHELCHRKHMNHSREFYAEIVRVFPNYAPCRAWLKEHGGEYLGRLP